MDSKLKQQLKEQIAFYATKYLYRPLPKRVKPEAYAAYAEGYNGFDKTGRSCVIGGVTVATDFERLVVGDYGPWVEFTAEQLSIIDQLTVPEGQRWRLDKEYIERQGLSIKYIWYQYGGVKVYHQQAGVKYADYRPGYYYISTLDFD